MLQIRTFVLLLVILVESIFVVIGSLRIWEALSAKERVQRYENELTDLRQQYDASLLQLRYVRSDRYVEDVARRDLGWSKEGETVFMVNEKAIELY